MRKLKVTEMGRLSVDEFKAAEKMPLTVVLDDVRSMYNVGSVLRSCDAFRVREVLLCGITAAPPHPEIHKTALGAEDSVDWRHCQSAPEAVRELQRRSVTVMAVEQCEGSTMLDTFRPEPGREYAVVLGNEVKGVAQGSCRRLRRLSRNTAIRHEALPKRVGNGRNSSLSIHNPQFIVHRQL